MQSQGEENKVRCIAPERKKRKKEKEKKKNPKLFLKIVDCNLSSQSNLKIEVSEVLS